MTWTSKNRRLHQGSISLALFKFTKAASLQLLRMVLDFGFTFFDQVAYTTAEASTQVGEYFQLPIYRTSNSGTSIPLFVRYYLASNTAQRIYHN